MMIRNKMRGFTLIEAMIVVAIIGLIAAIGYPAYRDQVMKSRRADGMAFAMEIADRLERYYSDKSAYTTTITDLGYTDKYEPHAGYYEAKIVTTDATQQDYTITVEPVLGRSQAKDKCKKFIVNSQGARTSDPAECWE
jgi:type IV pilus assembly protein PilE